MGDKTTLEKEKAKLQLQTTKKKIIQNLGASSQGEQDESPLLQTTNNY